MIGRCTRCGEDEILITVLCKIGGHSLPSLAYSEFRIPTTESTCGACITDRELVQMLIPVVDFALGALLVDIAKDTHFPEHVVALETARAYFTVYNNGDPDRNRKTALTAVGLA